MFVTCLTCTSRPTLLLDIHTAEFNVMHFVDCPYSQYFTFSNFVIFLIINCKEGTGTNINSFTKTDDLE